MEKLLDKISSYNILNYLLPGILFSFFSDYFTNMKIISQMKDNIFLSLFIFYFLGSIISRIGSLFIEPILEKLNFVQKSSYENYIKAAQKDSKIEMLSEVNTMYRTFLSLSISLLICYFYEKISHCLNFNSDINFYIFILMIFILYLFSYKKQTSYIKNRIEIANKTQ
jgi:hypothetical protein